MKPFTVFSISTRQALFYQQGGCINIYPDPDWALIDGNFIDGSYLLSADKHSAILKTEIYYSINKTTIIADSVDVAVISGLPSGAQALFENELHEVPSGVIEIDADIAGEYIIVLK